MALRLGLARGWVQAERSAYLPTKPNAHVGAEVAISSARVKASAYGWLRDGP
ncbi:hypothetical protein APY04_2421 [Hyphomicrobium sulfonivorans]|uniref:Uncharacterized protein n=1 Tax=Hyphomicrobium sulfonivorans TaxID=121290 RepID=A0A120CUG7_HYPSL|nr:hypothetical protein APY04_2421 [Hyphomicrobium sulfonivorans]